MKHGARLCAPQAAPVALHPLEAACPHSTAQGQACVSSFEQACCCSLTSGSCTAVKGLLCEWCLFVACRARPGAFVVNPNGSTYSYFQTTLDPVAQNLFRPPFVNLLNNSEDGRIQPLCLVWHICLGRTCVPLQLGLCLAAPLRMWSERCSHVMLHGRFAVSSGSLPLKAAMQASSACAFVPCLEESPSGINACSSLVPGVVKAVHSTAWPACTAG